jgi:hypothetical protein
MMVHELEFGILLFPQDYLVEPKLSSAYEQVRRITGFRIRGPAIDGAHAGAGTLARNFPLNAS